MKITVKLDKPIDTIEDCFCNKCGSSLRRSASTDSLGEYCGLVEAEVTGGFSSTQIGDGDVHKFSLCEVCLVELFSTFVYSSFQGNYLVPDPDNQVADFNPRSYHGDSVPFSLMTEEEFQNSMNEYYGTPNTFLDEPIIIDKSEDIEEILLQEFAKPPKKEDMN